MQFTPTMNTLAGLWELAPADLAPQIDSSQLGFHTTDELEPPDAVVG